MEVATFRQPFRYVVPQAVLNDSHAFLHACGLDGCEGMALWVGRPASDQSKIEIMRVFVPEQVCIKSEYGVAVDMTPQAHYTLTDNLMPGERFYIRIHSHPEEAFHSGRDDENAVLTHQGAISIVIPDFARNPIRLSQCAIFQLVHGQGWTALSKATVRQLFQEAS